MEDGFAGQATESMTQTGCFTVGQVSLPHAMIPLFLMQVLSDVTLQKARASASSPNDDVFFAFHGIPEIFDIHFVGLEDTAPLDTALVLQDFEAPQREALSAAVRDNLPKFPVEMQANCQLTHFSYQIFKPGSHSMS